NSSSRASSRARWSWPAGGLSWPDSTWARRTRVTTPPHRDPRQANWEERRRRSRDEVGPDARLLPHGRSNTLRRRVPVPSPGSVPRAGHSATVHQRGAAPPLGRWTSTYMALHPFLYGVIFAGIYLGLRGRCGFPTGVRGGLAYGAGVFVVGSLPVYAHTFASFQVSPEIIALFVRRALASTPQQARL